MFRFQRRFQQFGRSGTYLDALVVPVSISDQILGFGGQVYLPLVNQAIKGTKIKTGARKK